MSKRSGGKKKHPNWKMGVRHKNSSDKSFIRTKAWTASSEAPA